MELQAFDQNLRLAGVVRFKSLIWIQRFNRVGACEVYAPATDKNLQILKNGNYLHIMRNDGPIDTMTCQIVDVKKSSNPDDGEFITAIGFDAKYYLDNRVNVTLQIFSASGYPGAALEGFIWTMLTTGGPRRLLKPNGYPLVLRPGDASDVEGDVSQQVFGLSYGRMTRQICGSLNLGYAFIMSDTHDAGAQPTPDGLPGFIFRTYTAQDLRNSVVFSQKNHNIGNATYEHDLRNLRNVCYIQNPEVRYRASVLGSAQFTSRKETFLQTSVTPNMEYEQIRAALDGTWSLVPSGANVNLSCTDLFVPVLSSWQLSRLQSWQPGGDTTTKDGYFHVSGPVIVGTAENVQAADVSDSTTFTLVDTLYDYVQLCAGVEHLRDLQEKEILDVEMIDNTYVYGEDYHLGDIVTVEAYGTKTAAQIVEVMECWDENGYHLEPRTEYTDAESEQE